MRRDSVTSTSSDYSTASDSSNKSSGSSDKSEFEVQIKERENPNEDYKRPELCKTLLKMLLSFLI
jgi:protein KRI1